jgi:hypothetical protein
VDKRKLLTALGAAAVCAALLIAYYARISTAQEQGRAVNTSGAVNADSARERLSTQPVPQISERTFKPAPSPITGSYTEPAAPEDPKPEDSGNQKNIAR